MKFLVDFCKLYPAYYRNTQNLFDEIGQILVQNKIFSLETLKKSLENLEPMDQNNGTKIISEEDTLKYGKVKIINNKRNQRISNKEN